MSLTIYSSSAGSGKTHTLAREYLCLLLRKPEQAQQILAVTFTNKATGEMKARVIKFLFQLREGLNPGLASELADYLQLDQERIARLASASLRHLLHHFSDYRIMTIDKFFQQIVRNFARDFDLSPGYRLELDTNAVIDDVLGELYQQIGTNTELRKWLERIVEDQIENGKNWNFRDNLSAFAKEIFKEHYQQLDWGMSDDSLAELYAKLNVVAKSFENEVYRKASALQSHFDAFDSFKENLEKKSGNAAFVVWKKAFAGDFTFIDQVNYQKVLDPDYEMVKAGVSSNEVHSWAAELMPQFRDLVNFIDENYEHYISSIHIKKNFAPLAITRIIAREVQHYKQQNDIFLLAEAQFFLNKLIGANDASFVYEKVGNSIKHFLIDEFQDTSNGQWNNFLPLLTNSLSQSNFNLLVGDVKQSIYRFRGGDLRLLLEKAEKDLVHLGVQKQYLQRNWRSKANVVDFNNAVFQFLPGKFQQALLGKGVVNAHLLDLAYADAKQVCQAQNDKEKGFVQLHFPEKSEEGDIKEVIADSFIKQIKCLQDNGYKASQIAVLVDKNTEGATVAAWLADAAADEQNEKYSFEFISSDSLLCGSSLAVQCLVAGLKFVANSSDIFSFREYLVFKNKLKGQTGIVFEILAASTQNLAIEYADEMAEMNQLQAYPLNEIIARLVLLSQVHSNENDLQFTQLFVEQVYQFSVNESNDLLAFLTRWQSAGKSLKLSAPEGTEAITIITIHKSKGLEFDVVLMPFASITQFKGGQLANYLWTSSNQQPFVAGQPVCVKTSKELLHTYFSEEYRQEKMDESLDALNKIYVAFTRAKIGFIGWFPPVHLNENLGNHMKNAVEEEMLPTNGHWNDEDSCWQLGEVVSPVHKMGEKLKSQIETHFPLSTHMQKLRTVLVKEATLKQQQDIGIAFHKAMASIHSMADVEKVKEYVSDEVFELILKTIDHPIITSFFEASWTVRNERNLLLTNGSLIRPDRWQSRNNQHVLIDFKTGKPIEKDHKQMEVYLDSLKKAGISQASGYLVYPNSNEVLELN